jgi:MOSC domain-containing protein YiiM
METGRLEAIWLKRFHDGPMDPKPAAVLEAGKGIVGNADFGRRRHVTIIERERWEAALQKLGVELDPSVRRANLLVSGVRLEQSRGQILRVGPCRIRIRGETTPCEMMDAAYPGLQEALRPDWGGGAFGEVLDGGAIAVGDAVAWEQARLAEPRA